MWPDSSLRSRDRPRRRSGGSQHRGGTAGLAEVAAGAIAMGLGSYLAAQSKRDYFDSEYRRERQEIEEIPDEVRREVAEVSRSYGLAGADLERVVTSLSAEPARWADFMMRFELGLERPAAGRAPQSALTIGLSYSLAGLVPLLPYMFMASLRDAFAVSIGVTLATLLVFGGIKGKLAGVSPVRAALQTMAVGGVAAAIAFRGRTNGQLVTIVGPLDVLRPLVVG